MKTLLDQFHAITMLANGFYYTEPISTKKAAILCTNLCISEQIKLLDIFLNKSKEEFNFEDLLKEMTLIKETLNKQII